MRPLPPNPCQRLLILCLLASGCAGYAGDVKEIRSALLAGDKARALRMSNLSLEVEEPDHYPKSVGGDNALLLLERGTVKLGMNLHESSSLDFRIADKHLELLDLKNDTAGNIAKWMFSDDATAYKAPPHEKLLLSSMNMLNHLSAGDLEGARVEARRLAIMQRHLADEESEEEARLGLGSYLAGFAFEMSGRYEQALQRYEQALEVGGYRSLEGPIRRLAACDPYRTERITALLGAAPEGQREPCALPAGTGTVLVVTSMGLAPYKEARRIPIGAALVIAAHVVHGPGLGASSSAQANELAAKGLLKWVNFPVMTRSRPRFTQAQVSVDGRAVASELAQDVATLALDAWDRVKGAMMGAAITRMITRAVAGEATNQAAKSGGAAGGLALLAGLAVEGALFAADTPDTRSWVTLPAAVFVSRIELPPGAHRVTVDFSGAAGGLQVTRTVTVTPGGYAVVSVAPLR